MKIRYNETKNNIVQQDTIKALFPTPVYFSKLTRDFTKKELDFVEKNKINPIKNEGNITSKDNYVLNSRPFAKLKKEIQLKVNSYFKEVISPVDGITPYITQSWLNYTETNQHHHLHSHPNSLVSGVLYFDCDEKFDKIKFHRNRSDVHTYIRWESKNWNVFNSEYWWFQLKTKDLIMFPSSLLHQVETKEGNNTRISLAFNVFIKGKIGKKYNLTELFLK